MSTLISEIQKQFSWPETISPSNFLDLLILTMKVVEDKKRSGAEKKRAVIEAMEIIFEKFPVLLAIVPTTIDALIAVEKHDIRINPKIQKVCCPFL